MITTRRYDLDWLRVIAIGLLMVYHTAVVFQPWGLMIGFITNTESWTDVWEPMQLVNIWRIPLLFFISGMGFYMSVKRRSWQQELKGKGLRLVLPLLWGCVLIVPLQTFLWQGYYGFSYTYVFQLGHLWFLGNLLLYILVLLPVVYFLKRGTTKVRKALNNTVWYVVLLLLIIPLLGVAESMWLRPQPYEFYAATRHGVLLGFWAFCSGIAIMLAGTVFWKIISDKRWGFLVLALIMGSYRLWFHEGSYPLYLLPIETCVWVVALLALAYRYLNRDSKVLIYLREAVLPLYILHMLFLFIGSWWVLNLSLPVPLKYFILLFFTAFSSWCVYEYLIRRIGILRLLFGLGKRKRMEEPVIR